MVDRRAPLSVVPGFVSKLDEFIHWLNEAMETTENWTPPKAETDSLKLYLETHLSFKLNVDSHCALKEAVVEEGRQLLELIVSHKSEGLKDMLQMIASQWKELQRQIKRQHSWILRALDIIKAEILATDVSAENEEGTGSPKAEVQLCYLEAQRDAVEQMSLKLYSEQYNSSSKRKEEFADMSKVHTVGSNGLLDFDSEYQELWDWLIDMESIVMDSHDLMMSEEQQQHLYKAVALAKVQRLLSSGCAAAPLCRSLARRAVAPSGSNKPWVPNKLCNMKANSRAVLASVMYTDNYKQQTLTSDRHERKKSGSSRESLNVIDASLMDLNGPSEDALEWDETDISNKLISVHEDLSDLDQEQKKDDLSRKTASGECGDNDVNEDENIVLHRNKIPDSNASFRKHLNRSVADESDVNVSMIVNVSCTSACTDDEDDSDLLSSSTLTLTEEELGIKDEDDDSSIATDEDIYEECNLISGLDYIKNELQTWIRPKFSLTREKRKSNLSDEIQHSKEVSNETSKATDTLSIETLLNGSVQKIPENNGNSKNVPRDHEKGTKGHLRKDISQVVKDQLVDDMENGNVENTLGSQKEVLVRTSATSRTHTSLDVREAENECCVCEAFTDSSDDSHMDGKETALLSDGSRNPPKECQSHLQSDCHGVAYSPAKKPCTESSSETNCVDMQASLPDGQQHRVSTTEKSTDCCAALKSNEAEHESSAGGPDSCCNCESATFDKRNLEDGSVHNFVMEIIDMASTALKSKSQPECESSAPASLTQIKEKVLEHSHRPIQLRKGDFYSYLSLSSHDSDCGEVIKYIEEKSSTPVPLDFTDDRENIECFFEACPEEERVEQQQSVSNGTTEARVEQQQPISNISSEIPPESPGKVTLESIGKAKTSSENRHLSFLCDDDININVPNPNKQNASNDLKNADDDLMISDRKMEDLEKNSPELSSKANTDTTGYRIKTNEQQSYDKNKKCTIKTIRNGKKSQDKGISSD
ncbi:A-kinase anchor protein 6 isoform X1 [Aix galericulata]|nr:A-kinase anchor protein 6 isoform X1 [Aix galericulata]